MLLDNMIAGLALTWVAILMGGWLGWQLLRQNGRMLLRLDELEKQLHELEFGDGEMPVGLPVGSEAPAFELPDLAGQRKSPVQYRGHAVLLIFFNPSCGFCRELVPKLAASSLRSSRREEALTSEQTPLHANGKNTDRDPLVLIITTGDADQNRTLFDEHQITWPVLLQKESEVAAAYKAKGTPSGYLINHEGKISSELAIGAEALLALASSQPSTLNSELESKDRASRFANHSLARTKIKRDGLKAGTTAPNFSLPLLDGHGELTLKDLRGRRVLLVFSSPGCGPCNALAPELEKFHRQQTTVEVGRVTPCAPQTDSIFQNGAHLVTRATSPIAVVMISKGELKENRAKVKEHGLSFPVVLQQQWETSRRYAMFATPIAYLIDEAGVIAHDVAVGVEPILALMAKAKTIDSVPELAETGR